MNQKHYHLRKGACTTLLLLFFCCSLAAENSLLRQLLAPHNLKNVPITKVFEVIESETDLVFIYSDEILKDLSRIVSVNTSDKTVSKIIDEVLTGTDMEYMLTGSQVAIYRGDKPLAAVISAPVVQQAIPIKITGRVTDANGDALPSANIILKSNNKTFTTTDVNGNFSIDIPRVNETITVSFVGMETSEFTVRAGTTHYNIVLQEDANTLKGAVVTGVFNKPRESYTGTVTTINSRELAIAGNRSVLTSIRNIDPSFHIMDNINLGSDPNALPSITVRGGTSLNIDINDIQANSQTLSSANMPLFIVDGFESTLQKIMDLDENLIESINLLKDASATSLYGARGANGVLVVSTKRPKQGKLQVTYKLSANFEAPDLSTYDLLNAEEKLRYEKLAGLYTINQNDHQQLAFDVLYNSRKLAVERGVNTYWLKYPVRLGTGQRHNLRLEGGEGAIRYAVTVGYNRIAGAMKGSDRNTFSGGVFLSYSLKNFIFRNDLQIMNTVAKHSNYGSFSEYAAINSYWRPYDDDGNLIKKLEDAQDYISLPGVGRSRQLNTVYNPLWNAYLPAKNESKYLDITNNFSAEWHIIPQEFFMRASLGVSVQNSRGDVYKSASHTSFDTWINDDYGRRGTYSYASGYNNSYEGNVTANYSKIFKDKHQLFAGLGFNAFQNTHESYVFVVEGMSILNMDFLGMAGQYAKDGRPAASEGITRRLGFTANANYTFDRRYFVDASAKMEGSSQFGADKRMAPFWSVGLGWNLHHENFLADSKIIDIAKVRASYGTSGSQAFNPYQALTMYQSLSGQSYMNWYGVNLMALGNPDLGWQKTTQLNVGADFSMFNNRVRLNVDYYNKLTNALLADINIPSSAGFRSYKANVGEVENKGVEASANFVLIRNSRNNFHWSVGGTLAHNKNTIKKISNSLEFLNNELLEESDVNPSYLYKEGQSLYTIYAVRSKGIDPSNGREIFIKQDGSETYTWDAKDKVACGDTEPALFGNINTSVRFKDFTLSVYFGYTLDRQIYNSTLANKVENILPYNNADRRVLTDRWHQPGDITYFKAINDFSTTYATSRFIMKENTFRCQTMTLRYDVPSQWLKKNLGLSYASFLYTMEDVFYISSIKRERGLDYPFSNKYSLSLTVRF